MCINCITVSSTTIKATQLELSHIISLLVNNSMTEFCSVNKPLMLGGLARLTVVAAALQ